MRAVIPALLLPLAVGCVPLGARTAPPGRGSDNSDYQNRSGIEIATPYAGGPQWVRPAGHLSDKSVPCSPGSGCRYRLDVSGGWYDAGDHGKYVVNGGISVWTLLNLYERTIGGPQSLTRKNAERDAVRHGEAERSLRPGRRQGSRRVCRRLG